MMATSGLVSRIQACDFSKPENTRFQYGSSVLPLSSAAPMAGTCDEPTPAMILATVHFRFAVLDFGLLSPCSSFWASLPVWRRTFARRVGGEKFRRRVLARARAVALHGAAALEHHVGVVLLRGAGHHRRQMLERMAVGGAELGGEIDVAAEFEHAVVIALEHGLGLLRRQLELLQVLRLVGLERPAVLVLHQRHAEHVDAVALARAFGVEDKSARDIVVIVLFAGHRRYSHLPSHI